MADSLTTSPTLTTVKHHTSSPTNTNRDTKTTNTSTTTTISFFNTRKTMNFAYFFTFIFIACAIFFFLNPSGSSSPWLNNFSSIFSHFLPNSTSSFSLQPNTPLQLSNRKDNQSLSNDEMGFSQSSKSQPLSAPTVSLSQESRNSSLNSTLQFSRKKEELSGKVEGSKESNQNPLLNGSSNINVSNHPVSSRSFMNNSRKDSQFSLKRENVSKNGSREGFLVKGRKEDWVEKMSKCNIYEGRWVRDDEYPLYAAGSCPHIDEPFNCFLNGRSENGYEKYRWQPMGCNIPR